MLNNRAETTIEARREPAAHDGGNSNLLLLKLSNTGNLIDYSRAKLTAVIFFSITCICFGAMTIVIQIVALLINLHSGFFHWTDISGHGIWGGALYLAVGSLGIAATQSRAKCCLMGTVATSSISIIFSLIGVSISLGAYSFELGVCQDSASMNCSFGLVWKNLQLILLNLHVLALFNSLILNILTSTSLCYCSARHTTVAKQTTQQNIVATRRRSELLIEEIYEDVV